MKYQREMVVGVILYVVLYYLAAWAIGIAAAIATPEGYFDWFRSRQLIWLGLLIWNLCTIYPAAALPSLIIAFAGVKISGVRWLPACIVVTVLYLAHFMHDQVLFAFNHPQLIKLNGYRAFLPSVVLPLFVFLGGYVANRYTTRTAI